MTDATSELRLCDGLRAGLPIALGPLLFGVSFGLLAKGAGVGSAASLVFSATTWARRSSSQWRSRPASRFSCATSRIAGCV